MVNILNEIDNAEETHFLRLLHFLRSFDREFFIGPVLRNNSSTPVACRAPEFYTRRTPREQPCDRFGPLCMRGPEERGQPSGPIPR
jgi:hypothetical protein